MPAIECAVDIWDLSGTDGGPNAEQLLEHLREFAEEGWNWCRCRSTSISSAMGQATSWCSSEPGALAATHRDEPSLAAGIPGLGRAGSVLPLTRQAGMRPSV